MTRQKGTLISSSNIEPNIAAPLDAREKVTSRSDLTAKDTFAYPYEGMEVYCEETQRKYILKGSDPTVASNWAQISDGNTEVVANPTGPTTTDLSKLQVGEIIYNIPSSRNGEIEHTIDIPFAKNSGNGLFEKIGSSHFIFYLKGTRLVKVCIVDIDLQGYAGTRHNLKNIGSCSWKYPKANLRLAINNVYPSREDQEKVYAEITKRFLSVDTPTILQFFNNNSYNTIGDTSANNQIIVLPNKLYRSTNNTNLIIGLSDVIMIQGLEEVNGEDVSMNTTDGLNIFVL